MSSGNSWGSSTSLLDLSSNSNPVVVIRSQDWVRSCSDQMERLGIETPLIVSSNGAAARNRLAEIFPDASIVDQVLPNPTIESCQSIVNFALATGYDAVIAIGGGSVMDSAKCAMAAIGTGAESLQKLLAWEGPYPRAVPSIFIPTTHGTASEVTMWGTLVDLQLKRKLSISHPALYPTVAILDGSLCLSLPMDISLTTSLDALSHSFEAIWNHNATEESTQFAISAICRILENVPLLKEDPNRREIRQNLLEAATTAGLAFSQTKTAAAHSISYPLTMIYNIPHGIASSISLVPLLDINGSSIQTPIDTIIAKLGLASLHDLQSRITGAAEGYLKFRLRDWGVGRGDIPELVKQSFTKGRMDNNIVALSADDVEHILESIY